MLGSIKIVIDVNWYISATANFKSREIFKKIFYSEYFDIYICPELDKEYDEVIHRPKFKLSVEEIREFKFIYFAKTISMELEGNIPKVTKDSKDDYLIALCRKCNADFLITGDKKHLLSLGNAGGADIVTMKDFINMFFW